MIALEDIVKIGRFYKPHGICGELNFSFVDDVFDRTEAPYWVIEIDGIFVPFFVESYRFRTETTALVKMEDINDEKAAKLLADHDVYYPKSYLVDSDEEEHDILSWQYFEGFQILDADAQPIGEILAVNDSTMNVFFEVKMHADASLKYLPAAEDFMLKIDAKNRCLYMEFPEGLLDLE